MPKLQPRRRLLRSSLLLLTALIVLGTLGFIAWASNPLGPEPQVETLLRSDSEVLVETGDFLSFRPATLTATSGLILYPGGRVDYRSYAPAARQIAAAGFLVIIPPMPLNLAFFSPNAANAIIDAHPQIETWVIGGHSLGGAMAARYAFQNPDRVQGLALWASYPADDLSSTALSVVSIYGVNDGVAVSEEIEASRPLLPADTQFVAIDGGNHAQFGAYGPQPGDGVATISAAEQQAQIAAATIQLLQTLD